MKKKLIIGIIASLFAVATVFNMGLLNFNKQSDATLEAITVMVKANKEKHEINPWYMWPTQGITKDEREEKRACPSNESTSASGNASYGDVGAGGSYDHSQENPQGRYEIICPYGYDNCTPVGC